MLYELLLFLRMFNADGAQIDRNDISKIHVEISKDMLDDLSSKLITESDDGFVRSILRNFLYSMTYDSESQSAFLTLRFK